MAFVAELAHCRDEVAPAPWKSVSAVIRDELGERARHLVQLEVTPLAAGSMAEVHGAALDDGTRVVVKVQRPGLRCVLAKDLAVLRLIARVAARCSSTLRAANPEALVEDFACGLSEQLSFSAELANLRRMRVALASLPVRLPRAWPALCSERVLVMERLDGISVSDFSSRCSNDADRRALVTTIAESVLIPALAGAVFHGDVHAGNMLVLPDGELGLLDFGLVCRLEPALADRLAETLAAVAGGRLAEAALGIVSLAKGECADLAAFVGELQGFVSTCLDRPIGEISIARTLAALLPLAARNGLELPDELVAFFKQLIYLDGVCQELEPSFDLLQDGGRLIEHARAPREYPCEPATPCRRVTVPARAVMHG